MDWDVVIRAVVGEPAALKQMAEAEWSHDVAVSAALLLLEETPHPAAALVVAGMAALDGHGPPLAAALTPHVAAALAAWRADPDWTEQRIRIRGPGDLIDGVVHLIAALHHDLAALRDAVGIVARDGDANDVAACLAALGAAGWGLLADEERGALWTRALQDRPFALGCVWSELTDAQREAAAQHAAAEGSPAALIGGIGAAAWETTDAALRERLIDAAAREPWYIDRCAPAWTGMSDAERTRLVTAVVDDGAPWDAYDLLDALGGDGRRALSAAQRGALDALVAQISAKMTALLRVVDAGWDGVSDADCALLLSHCASSGWDAADLIRAVGSDGWRALPPDVQKRLRASVQRDRSALFRCPPALWRDLADGRHLPPVSIADPKAISQWRAKDAADDLSAMPHGHQATVLALAQWRPDDLAPQSPRMARLLAAWNGMTSDARVALATAHPWTLAVVAAAARLAAREPAIAATSHLATAAVADTLTVMALRAGPEGGTRGVIGRLLAAGARWRPEMRAFAPTDDDAPEAWDAWLRAARIGAMTDRGVGLRLMADSAPGAQRGRRR